MADVDNFAVHGYETECVVRREVLEDDDGAVSYFWYTVRVDGCKYFGFFTEESEFFGSDVVVEEVVDGAFALVSFGSFLQSECVEVVSDGDAVIVVHVTSGFFVAVYLVLQTDCCFGVHVLEIFGVDAEGFAEKDERGDFMFVGWREPDVYAFAFVAVYYCRCVFAKEVFDVRRQFNILFK